ncbi:hypothetical protein CDAR_286651 [Caerostris darwini]|uniref:Uncharacterized protein n=1 Tax=Caerostris darwini TaxID=1538125 RepID=A0AAV4UU59_9ARAC|nr:hypothetical protein CDAR_286651 [Caerostris darwini]
MSINLDNVSSTIEELVQLSSISLSTTREKNALSCLFPFAYFPIGGDTDSECSYVSTFVPPRDKSWSPSKRCTVGASTQ